MKTGVGGSSGFTGLLDEWLMPWKPGQIILGTSLYEAGQKLGRKNNAHLITIATSQSGKGRSCIIPNLLTWPGSALVVDPKGQNAAVTAEARRGLGQTVHIVDPFKMLERLGLDPFIYRSQRLNPLAEIRLDDLDAVEQIRNLGAALVMPSPHGNPFWDNAARQILEGILAHVLTWEKLPGNERHLGTVRDYVAQTNTRRMGDLRGNMAVGGLADKAEALFKQSSDSAGGDIMTTLNVHMQWLDSPAMQEAMAVSDFSFAELKHTDSTVYLVIPPEYLDTHARYLRLFITLALRAAGKGRKAKHAMLFVLDEFAALGELKVVADAAGQLAGMGVKLWPIIQNLTQLRPYGDNWEVFLANAGQQQIFAVNDKSTADYFSDRLGQHIAWRKVRAQQGYEWMPQGPAWLRTSPELARESSKDSEKALIFFEGGDVSIMRRAAYDGLFTTKQYSPDPYLPPPPVYSLAGIQAAARGFGRRLDGIKEDGFERLIHSRVGPRVVALLGDRFSAEAMMDAMAIYNAKTEAGQCAAFNRAVDALNRAVKDGKAADVRFQRRVFAEYAGLVERKGAGNETELRLLAEAQKLRMYTPLLPAPPVQEPAGEGAAPDLTDPIEAAPPPVIEDQPDAPSCAP